MSAHDHREFVEGCFRCDLSRAEYDGETCMVPECDQPAVSEGEQIEADLLAILERDDGEPHLVPREWTLQMYESVKASNERVRRLAALVAPSRDGLSAGGGDGDEC